MHKIPPLYRQALKELEEVREAREVEGQPFQTVRHARYFEEGTPYHIISKTLQSIYALAPDKRYVLQSLIAGVIARAQKRYKIKLYAAAFMSNHFHMMLSGTATGVVRFVGYVKREISRRWRRVINWGGSMWEPYEAAALVTEEAQAKCLKYILSQSVKEGIVRSPTEWPGFHCAQALLDGTAVKGTWLNATKYGKAKYKHKKANKKGKVDKKKFIEHDWDVHFVRLPAWKDRDEADYRRYIKKLVDEVIAEGDAARKGRKPIGLKKLFATSRDRQGDVSPPPWFEERRRFIVWDNFRAAEVRDYLTRYWRFQTAFREASAALCGGQLDVEFPAGAFRPGLPQPEYEQRPAA